MLPALGDVLPQAVAIAISPIPIVLVILMLVTPRARSTGPAFAVGWFVGVLGVTLVVSLIADGADVGTDEGSQDGGSIVQLLLGALFVFLAVKQWRGRPRPGVTTPTPKLFAAVDAMTVPKCGLLGLAGAVANPKNLPLLISAGVAIPATGASGGESIGAVVVFSLLASLTVIVPVVVVVVLGARSRATMDALKDWLIANNATIMTVLFAVLGAKMLGSGLAVFH